MSRKKPSMRKRLRQYLDRIALRTLSRSRFGSCLYYLIFSHEFLDEQLAVLRGRLRYEENKIAGENHVLVRRNIHRLEKGLIMRPRRDTFGVDYIFSTVQSLRECLKSDILSQGEVKWAFDVLAEYFDSVDSTDSEIGKSKELFFKFEQLQLTGNISASKPYLEKDREKSSINFENLILLFKQRRSIRWFSNVKVEHEVINQAIDACSFAPSACNRQPFKFYICDEKPLTTNIAECAMGTAGFSKNIQTIIAVVGDLSYYPFERDRHVIYIDSSLATMQLMLALETLGVGTCAINWPDIPSREARISSLLKLNKYEKVIMLVAIGYPDPEGGVPYSHKKTHHSLVKYLEN